MCIFTFKDCLEMLMEKATAVSTLNEAKFSGVDDSPLPQSTATTPNAFEPLRCSHLPSSALKQDST